MEFYVIPRCSKFINLQDDPKVKLKSYRIWIKIRMNKKILALNIYST